MKAKAKTEWNTRPTEWSLSFSRSLALMAVLCIFASLVRGSAYTGLLWTPATQWSNQTGQGANTQQCVCTIQNAA